VDKRTNVFGSLEVLVRDHRAVELAGSVLDYDFAESFSPGGKPRVAVKYIGVTSVARRMAWTNDFTPSVPSVTTVFDFRLSRRNPVHYVRNGRTEADGRD